MCEVGFLFGMISVLLRAGRGLIGSAIGGKMSTGGEVANALVCKTSIRGFNSRPVLQ